MDRRLERVGRRYGLTQTSPRRFQRGPKCFGAQMHRAFLLDTSTVAYLDTPNITYPALRLFGKVNTAARSRAREHCHPLGVRGGPSQRHVEDCYERLWPTLD